MTYRGPTVVLRKGRALLRRAAAPDDSSELVAAGSEVVATLPPYISRRRGVLLILFVLFTFIPVSQYIMSIRLTPMTVLLLSGTVPFTVFWLGRKYGRNVLPDYLMLTFSLWAVVSLSLNHGLAGGMQPSGIIFITTFGAYLAGRFLVRDVNSWYRLSSLLFLALLIILPFVVFESLTDSKPLIKLMSLLGDGIPPVQKEKRMGLARAQGPFEHPILLGIFMASLASLLTYTKRAQGRRRDQFASFLLSTVGVFCSVSTGPLLSLNVQYFLMVYNRLFGFFKSRWAFLMIAMVVLYIALDAVTTRSPFHTFARYATFNTQSSYNRILIWQFGTASVAKHFWFGIGLNEWERPSFMSSSMDNFWLVQAVRYGMPAFLMYAAAVLAVLLRLGRADLIDPGLQLIRRGIVFTFVGTIIAVTSVHLWNACYIWFNFLLGASIWLTMPEQAAAVTGPSDPVRGDPVKPPRRVVRPTRRL